MVRPKVLVLNLATDADDPVLGFTTSWVDALARHSAHVDVITMRAGRLELPSNVVVHSLGKEQGFSEPRRLVEFYRALGRVLSARRIDMCFAHMAPLFAVLASPVLMPLQIPIVTWYAHPRLTQTLRLAHRVSTAMVTSLPSAYPHRSNKLHVIGQGIDTEAFKPGSSPLDKRLILCVGRLSRVKDHATLLRAASILQREAPGSFDVNVVGGVARTEDMAYSSELMAEAQRERLEGIVKFIGPVARAELPAWYCRAAVHVNLTPKGFGDKVALEAMSCATPCLTANTESADHARRPRRYTAVRSRRLRRARSKAAPRAHDAGERSARHGPGPPRASRRSARSRPASQADSRYRPRRPRRRQRRRLQLSATYFFAGGRCRDDQWISLMRQPVFRRVSTIDSAPRKLTGLL